MINQDLLYGVLVLILAYMRINPGKNILCYVILFLIALVILFPVEGWSTADAATTDAATTDPDIFYDFEAFPFHLEWHQEFLVCHFLEIRTLD